MPHPAFQALLAAAADGDGETARVTARIAARAAWVKQMADALADAQRRADEAWDRLLRDHPEEEDEEYEPSFPRPPEEDEVERLHAQIKAVVDKDMWPRELYWKDV